MVLVFPPVDWTAIVPPWSTNTLCSSFDVGVVVVYGIDLRSPFPFCTQFTRLQYSFQLYSRLVSSFGNNASCEWPYTQGNVLMSAGMMACSLELARRLEI